MKHLHLLFFTFAFVAFAFAASARAGGPIHLTVTDCNSDAELHNAVDDLQNGEGGTLDFDCGTATIVLASELPEITHDTVIDGADKITLSGNSAVRLFRVNKTGALTLKNIVVQNGYGGVGVGGAIINNGLLTVEHATLRYNYTPKEGGAIAAYNTVAIHNSTFLHNIASSGGAIYADAGAANFKITISNSQFLENSAASDKFGGAINAFAQLNIQGSKFENNRAGGGGAIYLNYLYAKSGIADSTFNKNYSTGTAQNANGGALWMTAGAPVTIERTTFSENKAQTGGALAVTTSSELEISSSTFEKNEAANGGALYNANKALVSQSTFYSNKGSNGAGIHNLGSLLLFNSTFSENYGDFGAGLKNQAGSAQVIYVTFEKNLAYVSGGAIWNNSTGNPTLALVNNIVANPPSGSNCYFGSAPTLNKGNLASDNSCNFGAGRDNVALELVPLANNGGLTRTHMPLPGSPAIDGGAFTDFGNDQRGVARPQGAALDVGAVEVEPNLCSGKPDKSVLLTPGDGNKVKRPTVALDWQDTACATTYKVLIKLGSPSGPKFQSKGGLTTSIFNTKTLTKGQLYVWRVLAINNTGKSKSDWWSFTAK